jgi:hypothetical protein
MKRFSTLFALLSFATSGLSQTRFDDLSLLPSEERISITPEAIKSMTQAELDTFYAQLASGPIPNGEFHGTAIFDKSDDNQAEKIFAILFPYGFGENFIKQLGVRFWKGKIFDAQEGRLTNRFAGIKRFPASMFCGQSLLDSRRESIVLDYNYADQLPTYVPLVDWSMTRYGLGIRDEIRMVRPGLYLGRAYIKGTFALNFVLESIEDTDNGDWGHACKA